VSSDGTSRVCQHHPSPKTGLKGAPSLGSKPAEEWLGLARTKYSIGKDPASKKMLNLRELSLDRDIFLTYVVSSRRILSNRDTIRKKNAVVSASPHTHFRPPQGELVLASDHVYLCG
jgi:hypothetical protein